jgi:diguanylate cyclase (GGDEF)-like protein
MASPTTPILARHRQPLRRRLQFGLATLCVLALMAGSAVAIVLSVAMTELRAEISRTDELESYASALEVALLEQQSGFRGYLLTGDDSYNGEFRAALADERFALNGLYRLAQEPELIEAVSNVGVAAQSWRETWTAPLIEQVAGGKAVEARDAATSPVGVRLFDNIRQGLGQLQGYLGLSHQATEETLSRTEVQIVAVMAAAVTLMALGVISGAIWVLRRLSNPLDRLVRTAEALERGDDVSFDSHRADEIGMLAGSLERLQRTLRGRYQAAAEAAERGTVFNQVSELISYADDEEAIVRAARAAVERLLPSRAGDLLLINPSLDRLRVAAAWGGPLASVEPLDETRPAQCPAIRRSAPHLVPVSGDDLSLPCRVHPVTNGSLACLPVLAHGEPIGVVHLEREAGEAFDDEELRLVTRLTEQLGLALSNLRLMRKMETQAMTDPLTGLANARFFDPVLERQLAAAQRDGSSVGVLALDLDHFKDFNDRYGHPAGDEALRAFARVVRGHLRDSDTAARMGGEEFAVALHDTNWLGASQAAEKLRAAVEGTAIEISPGRFARITVSIGVAASETHGTDRMHLLKVADEALYTAKRSGRNRIAVADGIPAGDAESVKTPTPISHAAGSARRRPVAERSSS